MIYDNIIIGAGIAGLYTVYMLLQKNPNQTFIILEENSKKDIGGRIVVNKFHGVDVLGGAGIGRFNKDTLLKNLLDELKISYGNQDRLLVNNINGTVTFTVIETSEQSKDRIHLTYPLTMTFSAIRLVKYNEKEYDELGGVIMARYLEYRD